MNEKTTPVEDKKAEIGINLSVIIQTLMLASIIGFGTWMKEGISDLNDSVRELTASIATLNTGMLINSNEIDHLRKEIDDHITLYHGVTK